MEFYMSMNFKENKAIQKQLIAINKKEMKILNKKEGGYLKDAISPYKDKLEEKIPDKLQDTLEVAFQKGFKLIFEKGISVIEKTYNKECINMEFDINTYAVNKYPTKKNIKKIDKAASKKTLLNKSITVIEGTTLGLLGIGLPDIPIYIGVILKTIYEISLSYGFDYKSENEKCYILNIICASVTSGEEKKYYFNKLDTIADEIKINDSINYSLDELLIETSKKYLLIC